MDKLHSDHWNNYWEKGTVTSFYKKFAGNYAGAIKTHWNNILKDVKNKD